MNIIGWLLTGALIAWMGRSVIHTDAQMGIIPNVIVGVIAAGLAGWLLSPLVGVWTFSAFRTRWRERPPLAVVNVVGHHRPATTHVSPARGSELVRSG